MFKIAKMLLIALALVMFMISCASTSRMKKLERKQEIDSLNIWGVLQGESKTMGDIHIRLDNLEKAVEDLRKPYFVEH